MINNKVRSLAYDLIHIAMLTLVNRVVCVCVCVPLNLCAAILLVESCITEITFRVFADADDDDVVDDRRRRAAT